MSFSERIAISGSSGLIGTALSESFASEPVQIQRLVRDKSHARDPDVYWDPEKGEIDAAALEGVDAVVHLAGESIAGGRWNQARKSRILESRRRGTRLICETLAGLERKPRVLVSASAIGYYGDRQSNWMDEDCSPGSGFLPEVCIAWEAETRPARDAGIRVVNLRIGLVLSRKGGLLANLRIPFGLGLGGKLGGGQQYMSWIHLDDVVGLLRHALSTEELSGPLNAVAPEPVSNAEFTRVLGAVLRRPTLFSVPAFAIRALAGEMGPALMLGGVRVAAKRARDSGHHFHFSDLESALRKELQRA
ncbi:MAG: TIGR01777 family protein [bacterium]|nr:TIGR01777 family protein [bacterium]